MWACLDQLHLIQVCLNAGCLHTKKFLPIHHRKQPLSHKMEDKALWVPSSLAFAVLPGRGLASLGSRAGVAGLEQVFRG